ncbi:MAG TPA: pseudouridine-5'-phosphate glycosidase [Anaerolineales bacterium]|nr:pseudouridine-5'-phosphate glycosidase [Anaerolineales bacterium]
MAFPGWLRVSDPVRSALASGKPVVALESTVITHGLPRPANLELARRMELEVLSHAAQPATVAVVDGHISLGLTSDELERLALSDDVEKVSRRDLATVSVGGGLGGTTVAATMVVAHSGGVHLMATGGIGGVHRGSAGDVSADLPELAQTSVAVVCSGAKSILDLPRTLEWLETASVPVIGWETDEFPSFFSKSSGLSTTCSVRSAEEAAELLKVHWRISPSRGALICVPCPEGAAIPAEEIETALAQAEADASAAGVAGKAITPYILSRLVELTDGATLRANLALLRNNAVIAAELAVALARG